MPAASKKTLVLGASDNAARYSFQAINKLRNHHHLVVAIGSRASMVADVQVIADKVPIPDLDTVTVYLNPANQKSYYNYVIDQSPHRVIFNPGAENEEFENILQGKGIETVHACTLVLLATGQF